MKPLFTLLVLISTLACLRSQEVEWLFVETARDCEAQTLCYDVSIVSLIDSFQYGNSNIRFFYDAQLLTIIPGSYFKSLDIPEYTMEVKDEAVASLPDAARPPYKDSIGFLNIVYNYQLPNPIRAVTFYEGDTNSIISNFCFEINDPMLFEDSDSCVRMDFATPIPGVFSGTVVLTTAGPNGRGLTLALNDLGDECEECFIETCDPECDIVENCDLLADDIEVCVDGCTTYQVYFGQTPPYTFNFTIQTQDNPSNMIDGIFEDVSFDTEFTICHSDRVALSNDTIYTNADLTINPVSIETPNCLVEQNNLKSLPFQIKILPTYDITLEPEVVCIEDSIMFGGQLIDQQGEYIDSLLTAKGCDSIIHKVFGLEYCETGIFAEAAEHVCADDPKQIIIYNRRQNAFDYSITGDDGTVTTGRVESTQDSVIVEVGSSVDYVISFTNLMFGDQEDIAVQIGNVGIDTIQIEELSGLTCDNPNSGALEVIVNGANTGFQILWNTGATTAQINNLSKGVYTAEVTTDQGCNLQDQYELLLDSVQINLPDTIVSKVDSLVLVEAMDVDNVDILRMISNDVGPLECQDDPCLSFIITTETSGNLVVAAENDHCTILDSIFFVIEEEPIDTMMPPDTMPPPINLIVGFPNVFRDGAVDDRDRYFYPQFNVAEAEGLLEMQVFDRWGSLVYQLRTNNLTDYRQGWDGTFNGRKSDSQVFVYIINIQAEGIVEPIERKGTVLFMSNNTQ